MGNYTYNTMNTLTAEYEVSEVLEHFNSQYIYDVIQQRINTKFLPNITMTSSAPNIVLSFEDNFKRVFAAYPEDTENIKSVRDETYREIIDIICKNYNIVFNYYDESIDPYVFAYYLYDFFVANYTNYIAKFFAEYIFKNKDSLYSALSLDNYKKQRDGAVTYGKKIYEDSKLAIINANIVMVVNAMQSFDIENRDVFYIVYGTKEIVDMMSACINTSYDLFNVFYQVPPDFQPILFTNIRLYLQSLAKSSMEVSTDVNS